MAELETIPEIDAPIRDYFANNLQQVFLYVTNRCNLICLHCLYKPYLYPYFRDKKLDVQTAISLLSTFKTWGASKLTIIGGEPTLYDVENQNRSLIKLLTEAKEIGYKYVGMDTNGIKIGTLLKNNGLTENLDELAFSLDGPTPEINDFIRGRGTFNQCVSNIKEAVKLGYNVTITSCIHRKYIENGHIIAGVKNINLLINLSTSLGINQLNFHPIFKMGVPRDAWIGDTEIPLQDWIGIESEIQKNIEMGVYNIPIRIPKRFITKEVFEKNPIYYGYCPVKMGERILVHPDGILRICALLIGTAYGVGRYDTSHILWDSSATNEILNHSLNGNTPCQNQYFENSDLLPLCISFKPQQNEYIWKRKIHWEKHLFNKII